MSFIVNRRDLDFLLYELLGLDGLLRQERFSHYDRAAIDAVLDTAEAIAEDKYLPFAAKLDANEPLFEDGRVSIIPEVADALDAYRDAGFFAAAFDESDGGLQLPGMVALAAGGIFNAANSSVYSYSLLTAAAANMLRAFGSEEQKATFLPPMLEGRWYGTMCLSEPQAGSSLSDIRTRAVPTEEGHYLIEGSKMWISGGDHELSENIVEMVLAKIPGGPPGVKGISLFIVPKYRVNPDGSLGEKNNVTLAGLNHKMGYRGITNCLLNFGEEGECRGYLVGEPHRGLQYMFHMMNEARILIGYGATMSGLAGYLYSLDYARNRPQGRHPHDKDPESPPVMIAEHADVKRLLMAQKAYVEGAMGLLFYCSLLVDLQKDADEKERERLGLLLEILTPIAKSWPSEFCLEANRHAIQVLGGYGYTRDYPVERLYRDNRLNPIHEGTHAIHGLDLLGRKVAMRGGAAFAALIGEIEASLSDAGEDPALAGYADDLRAALDALREATEEALDCADLNLRLANAGPYLDAFGHVVIAWIWLRQARAASAALQKEAGRDTAFYEGKIAACRYFYRYELPKVFAAFDLVKSLDDTCLSVRPEQFVGA